MLLVKIAVVAAICGFLFGFDEGVIAGAFPFMQHVFKFTPFWEGLMTAAVPLGAAFGALFGAGMSDRYGRRLLLIGSAVLFVFGSVLVSLSFNVVMLTGTRILIGFAIGCSALVTPQYLSELSPPAIRGRTVAIFQLMIIIGTLIAYLSDLIFDSANLGPFSSDNARWRLMFLIAVIPAIILFFGMRSAPESPRWLVMKGKQAAALGVLKETQPELGQQELDRTMNEMVQDDQAWEQEIGWLHLFQPGIRRITLFCMTAFVFQQLSGINVVVYYAPQLMKQLNYSAVTAQISATVGIGVIYVLATIVALILIDRVGRRKLFIISFAGAAISLAVISFVLWTDNKADDVYALYGIWSFIIFFSIGIGPGPWVYMSELFPTELRGRGMALVQLVNWTMTFLVVFLFPIVSTAIGIVATFAFFAGFCCLAVVFALKYAPETKGIPLEELQARLGIGAGGRPATAG